MRCEKDDRAEFELEYRPTSEVFFARPGSLESFLTERYCLYASRRGVMARLNVHHRPWPLQMAEARISRNTLLDGLGLQVSEPALLHYSSGVDVVSWGRERGVPLMLQPQKA